MLVTAVHKETLDIVRNAAPNKLNEDWIILDNEDFINSVPKVFWKVVDGKLSEKSTEEKEPFIFSSLKEEMLYKIDEWVQRKGNEGIQVDEGVVLPSSTDNAVQLQVYLGTLTQGETIVVTDVNGNPQLIPPEKLMTYISIYQTEFKTRRITWATIKAQIRAAKDLTELQAINIPE